MEKYGAQWPVASSDLKIERACIRQGGKWLDEDGKECGRGLFFHHKNFQKLVWPWKAWHKWNDLILKELTENSYVGLLGAASTGKTMEVSSFILSDWWSFPECTTSLVSTTTLQMLDLRIWGEIKKLFKDGKERYPWLPGYINESKHRISHEAKSEAIRDFRNGIQGIACNKGTTFVGLANYAGIKNVRVRIAGDELALLPRSFCDVFNNLSKTPKDFKAIGMGNPKDQTDALGVLCEPSGGWDSVDRSEVTKTWSGRLPGCRVIQLVGTDSPNYAFADGQEKYPYLIKRSQIEKDIKYYGKNSLQVSMMDMGQMPIGGMSNRVITRQMCEQHHAMAEPIFQSKVTKIFALDAAYGTIGGDRCVGGECWFGHSVDGIETFALHGQPIVIPVNFKKRESAETQIAVAVRGECQARGIQPENVFFDSTGRGSLGTAFGRLWSTAVNPVEFGGKASDRPTSVVDRRPCHASYGKFVTELWYSARLVIEAGQMRGLTEEVVDEGQLREYMMIDGKKIDVEPKAKTRERMGRSPDLFDMLVVGLEGARRLGFQIASIGSTVVTGPTIWRNAFHKRLNYNRENRLVYA